MCSHAKFQVDLNVKRCGRKTMRLGELANITGLAASAIRFYERTSAGSNELPGPRCARSAARRAPACANIP